MRNLILIFGDQLSHELSALDGFDAERGDQVWMAEVDQEATQPACHRSRLVFFFSAMRHFRDELRARGLPVSYHELQPQPQHDSGATFREKLEKTLDREHPDKLIMTEPGDWRVRTEIEAVCSERELVLEVRNDRHFYCSTEEFQEWLDGRKSVVMETFYRWMRKKHRVLVDKQGKPVGGAWNFDAENRQPFGKEGPHDIPAIDGCQPDDLTRQVMEMVASRYADHPGSLEAFNYPVDAAGAQQALKEFISERLPKFGQFQDAMWTDTDFLYHSRISALLNAHLLQPFEVVNAAIDAFEAKRADIQAVEGFVRQVLGWREFVRGIYWALMPEYAERNELECDDRDVPAAYWDGQTDMNCIRQAMQPVLKYAYAHHIQRLMVLGLYAQLLGVHPWKFHQWHMAMYVDAVDWVSLPNTLGMSQHADGGVVGTKPYCASGNYIHRMSNYCQGCRYDPKQAVGERACPMTTMYWSFLSRHRQKFENNGRMKFQIANLDKKDPAELKQILKQAERLGK